MTLLTTAAQKSDGNISGCINTYGEYSQDPTHELQETPGKIVSFVQGGAPLLVVQHRVVSLATTDTQTTKACSTGCVCVYVYMYEYTHAHIYICNNNNTIEAINL